MTQEDVLAVFQAATGPICVPMVRQAFPDLDLPALEQLDSVLLDLVQSGTLVWVPRRQHRVHDIRCTHAHYQLLVR